MRKIMIPSLGLLLNFGILNSAMALTLEEQTLVYESYALEKKLDYTNSIEKMVKIVKNNPNDYFTNYRLGWLFSLAKKYKNSSDHYELAARINPTSIEPLSSLSLLYTNLGDFTQATAVGERLLKRDPNHYYGLMRTIYAQIKTKQFAPALTRAEAAVNLYPTDLIFLEQKGYLQMQLGKTAEAKQTLQFLLLLSPTNAYTQSVLTGTKSK